MTKNQNREGVELSSKSIAVKILEKNGIQVGGNLKEIFGSSKYAFILQINFFKEHKLCLIHKAKIPNF